MAFYGTLLLVFFIFGFNAGCNGVATPKIEIAVTPVIFGLVIAVFWLEGFFAGVIALVVGLVAGKTRYSLSPGLR